MPPTWLTIVAWISLALAFLTAAVIAADIYLRGPNDPVLTAGPKSTLRVFFQEFAGQKIRLDVVTSNDDGVHFGADKTIAAVTSAPPAGSGPKGGAVPPPLLGATTDSTSGETAVAIAAHDTPGQD